MMGNKNINIVEADQKKCTFIREVAMLTNTKIAIHNCRIEDLKFINTDLITARALAPLDKLIDYVDIYMNNNSLKNKIYPKMLFLKGKSYKNELLDLRKTRNIDFKIYQSLTDNCGKILYINKVNVIDS